MSSHLHPRSSEQGFTLVELSIVLVIIGLIVGGVLVGQDLIKAAEVRATVGQIEKYNSALNTFRTRFNAMPGDISNVAAANFGLAARTGNAGEGDANGLIEGSAAGAMVADGEVNLFWNDMTFANLVEGNFTGTNAPATTAAAAPVASFMPPARVGRGNHVAVYANGGLNFYQVA
ncbi:MAG: prepilin-type N-terminal cleavage/methylation domain-containing protein, partial [Alphaproteobacteria bacterium]|nr:prepilin-type N-terminal cleavage/methylation domain-containing protein [Alphaproteobacteria bacterium]